MAQKKYYWLKLKTDFFNQREIKKLRKIAGGDTFTIIYLKMQLLSIKNEGVITFEQTENHLDEQLALELDEELENIRLTLAFLHQNGLIEPISDVDYMMPQVVKSIGSECDSAERVRKLRAKEEALALQCNGHVTKSNTEIEIELELESELELKIDGEKRKRFITPTLEEITDYCSERRNTVDPNKFLDFYESKGWYVGKNKMKDWRAAVRNWEKSSQTSGRSKSDKHTVEKQTKYTEEELERMLLKKGGRNEV